jgi:multimeric flavodoxin WrbA
MKFYAISGSNRKKSNTVKLLRKSLDGIKDTVNSELPEENVELELVNLYKINFTGCKSCFACKRLGKKNYGLCPIKDDLKPILEGLRDCDGVILGTPIYFADVSGEMRSFFERFIFPSFRYSKNADSIAPKKMPTAVIYNMNISENIGNIYDYVYTNFESYIEIVYSKPYSLKVYNTYQFKDYSQYFMEMFDEAEKAKYRDEHFSIDLENAYNIGVKVARDAIKQF